MISGSLLEREGDRRPAVLQRLGPADRPGDLRADGDRVRSSAGSKTSKAAPCAKRTSGIVDGHRSSSPSSLHATLGTEDRLSGHRSGESAIYAGALGHDASCIQCGTPRSSGFALVGVQHCHHRPGIRHALRGSRGKSGADKSPPQMLWFAGLHPRASSYTLVTLPAGLTAAVRRVHRPFWHRSHVPRLHREVVDGGSSEATLSPGQTYVVQIDHYRLERFTMQYTGERMEVDQHQADDLRRPQSHRPERRQVELGVTCTRRSSSTRRCRSRRRPKCRCCTRCGTICTSWSAWSAR